MKISNYFSCNFITILISIIGICTTHSVVAQAFNITNDHFWNTSTGRPIYSRGGGIFKFEDPITKKKNTAGMGFITEKQNYTVMILP